MAGKTETKTPKEDKPFEMEAIAVPLANAAEKSGNKPIVQESLTIAWNDFANELKTEDTRLFSMLTAYAPKLEGETKIVFQINNPLQKEPLQKIHSKLLKHLQTALDNENAEIEIVLCEKNETKKAYTAEEKFEQMSCKNLALVNFKKQFALDFA